MPVSGSHAAPDGDRRAGICITFDVSTLWPPAKLLCYPPRRVSHRLHLPFWATKCRVQGFVRDISGQTGTMPYMNRIVSAALGVLPRWRGRANSVFQLSESAELKNTRRRA